MRRVEVADVSRVDSAESRSIPRSIPRCCLAVERGEKVMNTKVDTEVVESGYQGGYQGCWREYQGGYRGWLGLEGTRLVRVPKVEVGDVIRTVKLVGGFPCEAVGTGVTCPFDEISEGTGVSTVELAVDDAFDFVLDLAVNFDGGRWLLNPMRDGVGLVRFQEADMEDIVYLHGRWELESECMCGDLIEDLERSDESIVELV